MRKYRKEVLPFKRKLKNGHNKSYMLQLIKPYAQRYFKLLPHCQHSTDWIGRQTSCSGNQHVDVDIATNKRGTEGYTPTNKRGCEPVY